MTTIFPISIYGEGVPAKRARVRSKMVVIIPSQNNNRGHGRYPRRTTATCGLVYFAPPCICASRSIFIL